MEPLNTACVFIVDDDAAVREALAWLLRSRRLHSETFASAEAFASALQQRWPLGHSACLLLDIRMGGMSGLTLFDQLLAQERLTALPVIFLTGHADVRTAVEAVQRGAFDFYEKPFSDNALVDRVEQALQASGTQLAAQRAQAALAARLTELTEYFVICSASSTTQVKALADNVEWHLKYDHDEMPHHTEGYESAQWMLLDYGCAVLHVFMPEARKFYNLENLWKDGTPVTLEELGIEDK